MYGTKSYLVIGYCDADNAADLYTRRSTAGYVFILKEDHHEQAAVHCGCLDDRSRDYRSSTGNQKGPLAVPAAV